MTARIGDALSHALLLARPRPFQPLFCVAKIATGIAACSLSVTAEKTRSIGDCMAAMSPRLGTEAAGWLHLRITCANLAGYGDDFIHQ